MPSPTWALEPNGPIASQDFSLADGRNYLYLALTGNPADRPRNFGKVFESLGHVVHHIQDMAQPQHVRNDIHLSVYDVPAPSAYETYTDGLRALDLLPVADTGYGPGFVPDLRILRHARHFWEISGGGMAEFTSNNFVSKDTNFTVDTGTFLTDAEYAQPTPTPCAGRPLIQRPLGTEPDLLGASFGVPAEFWFVATPIRDRYLVPNGSETACNERTSTFSLFDNELESRDERLRFSLNKFNYSAAHRFLIPRAIAYSAGLINHFFRGRLTITSASRAGDDVILTVRNVSNAESELARATEPGAPAEFEVWYDTTGGARAATPVVQGARPPAGSGIAVDGTHTLRFAMPANVGAQTPMRFMLVFRGRVGGDEGVIGHRFGLPTANLLVRPNYLPADGVSGSRSLLWNGTQWEVGPAGLVAGNVDWRGNEPGEVLTWDGPQSRYFLPLTQRTGISSNIYYAGRILTRAPGNVLGTSIRTFDAARWINAVTYSSGFMRVWTRPFKLAYENDSLFSLPNSEDPDGNPDGWRLIDSRASDLPSTPIFFNSSGTEGQMIVGPDSTSNRFVTRVKLTIAGLSVTRQQSSTKGTGESRGSSFGEFTPSGTVFRGTGAVCASTLDYECTSSGTCTSQGGTFPACLQEVLEYEQRGAHALGSSNSVTFNTPTVVCIDYRGDTEVRCVIDRAADSSSSDTGTLTYRFDSTITTNPGTCGVTSVFDTVLSYTGTIISSFGALRSLRVGSVSVPLNGDEGLATFNESGALTTSPSAANVPSGSASFSQVSRTHTSRLLYVDARNGIVVANLRTDGWTRTFTSSDLRRINNIWSYTFTGVGEAESRDELAVHIGGQKHTLSSTVVPSPPPGGLLMQSGLRNGGSPGCTASSFSDPGTPQPFNDNFAIESSLHTVANFASAISQGFAVDEEGRTVASQTIWTRQADGTYQPTGVWNFLSEGNLESLLPEATSSAAYFPVGVLQ